MSIDELYDLILARANDLTAENSNTRRLLDAGPHEIGKKIVEEAAEVWMAAEHEGVARTTEEMSQLIYHLVVLMVSMQIKLSDVEKVL